MKAPQRYKRKGEQKEIISLKIKIEKPEFFSFFFLPKLEKRFCYQRRAYMYRNYSY